MPMVSDEELAQYFEQGGGSNQCPDCDELFPCWACRLAFDLRACRAELEEAKECMMAMESAIDLKAEMENMGNSLRTLQNSLHSEKAESARLREALGVVRELSEGAPELNMSNYDEEQVGELNNAMIEIYLVLHPDAALRGEVDDEKC